MMTALDISMNYHAIEELMSRVHMYRAKKNDRDGLIDTLDDVLTKLYQYRELMEHVLKNIEV